MISPHFLTKALTFCLILKQHNSVWFLVLCISSKLNDAKRQFIPDIKHFEQFLFAQLLSLLTAALNNSIVWIDSSQDDSNSNSKNNSDQKSSENSSKNSRSDSKKSKSSTNNDTIKPKATILTSITKPTM